MPRSTLAMMPTQPANSKGALAKVSQPRWLQKRGPIWIQTGEARRKGYAVWEIHPVMKMEMMQ
jgi:hypothetical protein